MNLSPTLLLDGATGTMLRTAYPDFPIPDLLNLSHPDTVAALHAAYLDAGADVIRTNTFNAHPDVMPEAEAVVRAGVRIARNEADKASGRRLVAGSIGPSGGGCQQMAALMIEGGVDILLCETFYSVPTFREALADCRQAITESGRPVPLWACCALFPGSASVTDMYATALAAGADAFGLNCVTVYTPLPIEGRRLPLLFLPNAGLPDASGHYLYDAEKWATEVNRRCSRVSHLLAVGGCCGTTPEYIRRLR